MPLFNYCFDLGWGGRAYAWTHCVTFSETAVKVLFDFAGVGRIAEMIGLFVS